MPDDQAQALAELPTSIGPLVRRHVEDAAFYWKQLRVDAGTPAGEPKHLSPTKRQAFQGLLEAHLDGIREAGTDAWPPALEALKRWRKAPECCAAGWAALSAAMAIRAGEEQAQSIAPPWDELWHTLRALRPHWDTLLPALHDAWQAATLGADAWPNAAQHLNAALKALSPAMRATPVAPYSTSRSLSAEPYRLAWCTAMASALGASCVSNP